MVTEQRAHQRFRTYRPARVAPAHRHLLEILTKDLSAGGARCVSPSLVPIGSKLHIEVVLFAGEAPIRADGQIVWIRTIPESEQFELGIAFQHVSERDRQRLSSCLSRLSHRLSAEVVPAV